MANKNQLRLIKSGKRIWNKWRLENPEIDIDLTNADLSKIDLAGANLSNADLTNVYFHKGKLSGSNLSHSTLHDANLSYAKLEKADISEAHLNRTILRNANLSGAILYKASCFQVDFFEANLLGANLSFGEFWNTQFNSADLSKSNLKNTTLCGSTFFDVNLSGANLTNANLRATILLHTNIKGAILNGCKIYGISAWGVKGKPKDQTSLIITNDIEKEITVDELQVAQFIYLLLNNKNIRNVIDTITSKAVLILGRFSKERKPILEALHKELRRRKYLPILFDFEGPKSRDITETVSTLAHMARFIIADLTDAKSLPQELQLIVPNLPSVPIQPILLTTKTEYGMFPHFRRYPWVLKTFKYSDTKHIIGSISENIINPLELKLKELQNT